jgi:hypothetical protein
MMSDAMIWATRGNLPDVKVVLASILAALALYQALLMAVGYGKLRPRFLGPAPASRAHRAIGDAAVVIALLTSAACLSYFEIEDDNLGHVSAASALLIVLAFKIAIVRRWLPGDRLLPWLGTAVLILFLLTWATSAARYLI